MKRDIENTDDIRLLVNEFYKQVRQDDLLAPVFEARIDDWPSHLETLYAFWNATLLGIRGYVGNPFSKHITLPVEAPHFEQWIHLFYATVDAYFQGPVADEAKRRSALIAQTFHSRIQSPSQYTPLELPAV